MGEVGRGSNAGGQARRRAADAGGWEGVERRQWDPASRAIILDGPRGPRAGNLDSLFHSGFRSTRLGTPHAAAPHTEPAADVKVRAHRPASTAYALHWAALGQACRVG
jgi:hypothetical protein